MICYCCSEDRDLVEMISCELVMILPSPSSPIEFMVPELYFLRISMMDPSLSLVSLTESCAASLSWIISDLILTCIKLYCMFYLLKNSYLLRIYLFTKAHLLLYWLILIHFNIVYYNYIRMVFILYSSVK